MGDTGKKCKKSGRNAKHIKAYNDRARFMHNTVRDVTKHVLKQPNDLAARTWLMDFVAERGGLDMVRKVKARLEQQGGKRGHEDEATS